MQLSTYTACALFALAASACSKEGSLGESNPGGAVQGPDNSLHVTDTNENATAKNYSCGPLGYRAAGNLLLGLGVQVKLDPLLNPLPLPGATPPPANGGGNQDQPTAAQAAYAAARSSFGVADYANRNAEATQVGTAQLAKMGDLFIEAAPEILEKFATAPRCGGVSLLDGQSHFTREALSCIGGEVASDDQVTLAGQLIDRAVAQGMTQQGAQELVIAGYLSAQFTCR
jgi:hypothetical protein